MHKVKLLKSILFGVIGLSIITIGITQLSKPKQDGTADTLWREYPVSYNTITASLDGGGTLEAPEYKQSFGTDVTIQEITVTVGQEVKAGDSLIIFSSDALQKKRKEIERSLKTAQRNLNDAKNNKAKYIAEQQLNQLQNSTNSEQTYQLNKRELEYAIHSGEQQVSQLNNQIETLQKKLSSQPTVSDGDAADTANEQLQQLKEQLDKVLFDLNTQNLSLDNLNKTYADQNATEGTRQELFKQIETLTTNSYNNTIANANAEIEQLKEDLQSVQSVIDSPVLTADTDGVITNIYYSAGDEVSAGKTILTIGCNENQLVTVSVSQEDILDIQIGQLVEMQFLSNPDETVQGHITQKSLIPSQGGEGVNYTVSIAFDDPPSDLLLGMTCSVKFILKRVENVLTLANKAIVLRDGKQYVTLRLPDGSYVEQEILTGFSDGHISEITSGLSNGDIVVVAG